MGLMKVYISVLTPVAKVVFGLDQLRRENERGRVKCFVVVTPNVSLSAVNLCQLLLIDDRLTHKPMLVVVEPVGKQMECYL